MTRISAETFGDWLKKKRESRGWSQTDLALESGVTKGYISNLERNLRQQVSNELVKPSVEVVDKLAKALDVSLTEARLIAGYAPPENEKISDDLDYELEHLFYASRDWSEENRVEAIENAKVIFRRYQEKEQNRKNSAGNDALSEAVLNEIERELKEPKKPPPLKMKTATDEDYDSAPGLRLNEEGRLVPDEKIKKPSE